MAIKLEYDFNFIEDKNMSRNCNRETKNLNNLIDFEKFESIWTDFLEKYASETEAFDINEDYELNDLEKAVLKAIADRFNEALQELDN